MFGVVSPQQYILANKYGMGKPQNSTYPRSGVWFWIWAVYGFVKTIYVCICCLVFYPRATIINRKKFIHKVNQETKSQKTSWDFVKFLFLDINNFVGAAYEPFLFGRLKVGQLAPAGKLYTLENKETDIKQILNQSTKSVQVLNFGSYTWPPFRYNIEHYIELFKQYGDRVEFLTIYIAEAHPSDRWALPDLNDSLGICYRVPRKIENKIYIAKDFIRHFNYPIPLYVDSMQDDTMTTYSAYPERLYLIKDGKIVYKGGPGPYCYCLEELEEYLKKL